MKGPRSITILLVGAICTACSGIQPRPPELPEAGQVAGIATPHLIVGNESALWCTSMFSSTLTKIDPQTRKPVARMTMPASHAVEDLATGFGAVWIASGGSKPAISRIDARSCRVVAETTLASLWGSKGKRAYVAVGEGAVWATVNVMDQLFRLDPATGNVTDTISVGPLAASDQLQRLAAGEGAVWVLHDRTVSRVDPGSRRVVARIAVPGLIAGVGEITTGGGSVWVAAGATLVRIDPRSNRVTDEISAAWDPSLPNNRYGIGHPVISGGTLCALLFQSAGSFMEPTLGRYALMEVDLRTRKVRGVRTLGSGDVSRLFFGPTLAMVSHKVWISQPTGLYLVPLTTPR